MRQVACPMCNGAHDVEAVEPSFERPDAFIAAIEQDPTCEVRESTDACDSRATFVETLNDWGVVWGHRCPNGFPA